MSLGRKASELQMTQWKRSDASLSSRASGSILEASSLMPYSFNLPLANNWSKYCRHAEREGCGVLWACVCVVGVVVLLRVAA